MKNKQTIFKTVLLFAFTLSLFSCNKDVVEPTPQQGDYATFTDARDGKIYKTIKIGNQEWMAENLVFKTATSSWTYWGFEENGVKYGRLYTWEAAKLAVPAGWHLPSDAEWKQLEMALGMSQAEADGIDYRGTDEGNKLKAKIGWAENGSGTDYIGASALPGGFRSNSGSFLAIGYYGYWWSSTENNSSKAWIRLIVASSPKIFRIDSFKEDAFSVRCVKDSQTN